MRLRLFTRLLLAVYFLEVGLLLVLLPWVVFWDRNHFADAVPLLGSVSRNPFVRGAVSGLGLVNLGAAVSELRAAFRGRHHRVV